MTGSLREAGIATQVVVAAYLALLAIALVILSAAPMVARLLGRKAKIPNPLEAVFGVGLLFGLPAGLAAGMALLVTPLLVAMPLPLAGWLLIACLALHGFYSAGRQSSNDVQGCKKLFTLGFSGFGLCWAISAIVLAEPPVGNMASFLRPLLMALPLALFIGRFSRRNPVKQAIGAGLVIAIFSAVAFLPVESGFAAAYLPSSDWLRFPVAGAVILSVCPILALPLQLLFGSRAIKPARNIRMMAALAGVGGLFGLYWAITRLLF
jgi:hypothetical protein